MNYIYIQKKTLRQTAICSFPVVFIQIIYCDHLSEIQTENTGFQKKINYLDSQNVKTMLIESCSYQGLGNPLFYETFEIGLNMASFSA